MKLLLAFLAILPLTIFSQEKERKLAIGLSISPDYCYRILVPDASSKWIADIRDSAEIPKMGYTTGPVINYRLNKRLTLNSGLLFADKGYKTDKKFDWTTPNGTNGTGDPAIPMRQIANYHYFYLDVPIILHCNIVATENWDFYTLAGVSADFFLSQKTVSYTEYGDGHKAKNNSTGSGYRPVNLSFTVGFGYRTDLSDKLMLAIEPVFRHSINSIIDAPIKGYLYSSGLDMRLFYKL